MEARTPLETIFDALDEVAGDDPTTYDIGDLAEHIWQRLWEAAVEVYPADALHLVVFNDDGGMFGGGEYELLGGKDFN